MTNTTGGRLPWEREQAQSNAGTVLMEIEAHATRIAAGAGALVLDLFRGPLEVEFKDKARRDPVSQADRRAEDYLRQAIHDRFPEHAILGEEGKDAGPSGAEFAWVLDPIDGTTNFINGLPIFAVSVGVLRRGRPAVGAIWTPLTPSGAPGVFSARAGGQATLDGNPISVDGRAPVVAENEAAGGSAGRQRSGIAAVPGGFGVMLTVAGARAAHRAGDPRVLGSMAVEASLVAAGVLQSAIFWGPKIWDVAAAVTIVRAAGGSALTREGKAWRELTRFQPPRDKQGARRPLRDWSAPLIVGTPPQAAAIVAGLRPTALGRVLQFMRHPVVRRAQKLARQIRNEFGPPRPPLSGSRRRG